MRRKLLKTILIVLIFLLTAGAMFFLGYLGMRSWCNCSQSKRSLDKYAKVIVEPVTFYAQKNSDSSKLVARKGIVFRKPGARATVLLCHGFMCDKADIRFLRVLFSDYHVMMFDFRAHGESKGVGCCTFGHDEAYDIRAAAHFIKSDSELGKVPLISYAFSMGAVSSINAQAQDGSLFDCAIWDCPFDSTHGIIKRSIENLKITLFGYTFALPGRSFLKKYAYNRYVQALFKAALQSIAKIDASDVETHMLPVDTVEAATKITIPTFFITCRNDEKSPLEGVQRIYDATHGYKRFWITNGRRHFDSFFHHPEKYMYKVCRFVEKFLNNEFKNKVPAKIYQDKPGT